MWAVRALISLYVGFNSRLGPPFPFLGLWVPAFFWAFFLLAPCGGLVGTCPAPSRDCLPIHRSCLACTLRDFPSSRLDSLVLIPVPCEPLWVLSGSPCSINPWGVGHRTRPPGSGAIPHSRPGVPVARVVSIHRHWAFSAVLPTRGLPDSWGIVSPPFLGLAC